MQDAARREIPEIEKGMVVLTTTISIAPLLGILGTVLGLCHVFYMVHIRAEALNPLGPADITYGVGQALISTACGLTVSIIVLIAHNYLADKIIKTTCLMESASADLLRAITSSTEYADDDDKENT